MPGECQYRQLKTIGVLPTVEYSELNRAQRTDRLMAFLRNPDRLHIGEFTDAFRAQLASIAGAFHAAEWHARI
jgi:hypothetical protein